LVDGTGPDETVARIRGWVIGLVRRRCRDGGCKGPAYATVMLGVWQRDRLRIVVLGVIFELLSRLLVAIARAGAVTTGRGRHWTLVEVRGGGRGHEQLVVLARGHAVAALWLRVAVAVV
jgi:hypothetical protein